eukprot:gene14654-21788_t
MAPKWAKMAPKWHNRREASSGSQSPRKWPKMAQNDPQTVPKTALNCPQTS